MFLPMSYWESPIASSNAILFLHISPSVALNIYPFLVFPESQI